ncbi:hypothetical protein [Enhygromyxa salina]|uniref:hypothetical protein n=1 Tax=Enhygromyxa salina TaxID=215803 RepID=UPI0011B249B4|nr:hypothetical protein [Enhygromyxa salina]
MYQCCSDDPAALLLSNLGATVTPDYQGRGGDGTPLFSGGNNPLSKSGMCVKVGSVPPALALADINAQGCPVPCNPNWGSGDLADVCGAGTICCQTTELEPEDCVLDLDMGDNGCYRPVTGTDIMGTGSSTNLTNWGGTKHKTHQDPSGTNCEVFVQGLPPSVLSSNNISSADVLRACYHRLTVADQRGFCLGGGPGVFCPLAQPNYRDACEQLNDQAFLQGCD